ncbi:unnamed protein product, partial [Meganyctiphanes norvegica]
LSAFSALVESQNTTGWTDTCKVDVCGNEDVTCLNSVDIMNNTCTCGGINNTCSCGDGYVNGSSGCQVAPPCKSPFIPVKDVGCAHIFPTKMNYSDARTLCQGEGGDLAAPNNVTDLKDYIMEYIASVDTSVD